MTKEQVLQIENQLTERFKTKHSDIKIHIDFVTGTDEIIISFFWNRISQEKWNEYKSFRIKSINYESTLISEIIPFFN